jgi:subtilisin family serine protease
VMWSEPMRVYRTQGAQRVGGDPLFAAQPAASLWHLADLHRVATGRGVTVAIIDSRIEVAHPDLAGQVIANEDFVIDGAKGPELHGTGVAGVIAAKADNGIGIAGIAPGARLMALRACWQTAGGSGAPTLCDSLSLARAIHFAIERKAQIINLSLAGPADPLLDQLIRLARQRQISVVAAFDPSLPKGGFPASLPGVIAVSDKSMAPFPAAVYDAPGREIPTTQPGGRWYLVNGSSYAAAHVSGLIALVRQFEATPALVAAGGTGGIIDACATLRRAAKTCVCDCGATPR